MTAREELERAIEAAITALDMLDGDPDAEADPAEEQGDDEHEWQAPHSYRAA